MRVCLWCCFFVELFFFFRSIAQFNMSWVFFEIEMCRHRDKQKQKQNQAKVETIEWTQNNTHGVIRRNHQVLCERSHAHRHVVHVLILQRSSTKQGGKRRLFNLTFEGEDFFPVDFAREIYVFPIESCLATCRCTCTPKRYQINRSPSHMNTQRSCITGAK